MKCTEAMTFECLVPCSSIDLYGRKAWGRGGGGWEEWVPIFYALQANKNLRVQKSFIWWVLWVKQLLRAEEQTCSGFFSSQ